MDAMDGASAADNGSGAGAVAVASPPPSAGLAAASVGAGVVTNTSSEMAPTPVAAVAGNASCTAARAGSEGPQAEAEEVQKKQAVAVVNTKCDDDKEGRPAVDVPPPADVQDGADGEVQKDSSSVKHGTATASASQEESASTPIAGAAKTPAVEAVDDAGGACKKSDDSVKNNNENEEEYPTWSTDDLVTWQNVQSGANSSNGSGCSAIDACSNFIENQLMTKNCADILAIQGSDAFHVCTCMKSLDASLARPVATFVAVTWANMSEDERVDQLHRWMYGPPYGSFELPMDSDPMDDDDSQLPSSSESRLICNNALIELLGISSDLWQKALDHEVEDGAQDEAVASSGIDQDNTPSKKGKRCATRPTMDSILRMRKRGEGCQSEQEAIGACEAFIRTHLLTKTCTSKNGSTKCTCMQTLASAIDSESNSIQSAATYVATTWYNMSDEEKMDQIVEWIRNKSGSRLPFILPGTNEITICRNALCEVLGVSYNKWRKAAKLKDPSGGLNNAGAESMILKTFDSMMKSAGPRAIETLTPGQIHQSATYVATVWYNMTQEEKLNQLEKWIQQKEEEDAFPFILPVCDSSETADAPKKICRNALCEVLFVPASWWKKAEKRAKPTRSKPRCSVGGCTKQSQGLRCKGMCLRHYDKTMEAESTSDDAVSREAAGSTQVTENPPDGSHATDAPLIPFAVVLEKPMGITLTQKGKNIRVSEIKPDSVAERSGKVSIGNVILAVNGKGVINKDLSGVAAMIKEGGSTVNILFLAGGSEQKREKTNVENPADCSSDTIHATKSLAEAEGQKEVLAGSATSPANKTNESIEIADQSSATVVAGLASLESVARRGPLCSVGGCTRGSQGLRCKGMCQYHYYEKYLAAKSICTDETPVKSAREKNQVDEMVVERAIAANARGRDSTILQTLTAVVKSAGPMAIDVCSNFIRTYLMQKTCSDWSSSSSKTTQCTCMQILLPDQIRSSATFVATAWCKMTQEQKLDHLTLCIQQKGDDSLPYCLPIAESSSGRPMSTKICRNALCAILFVPTTLWRKAEERACMLAHAKESSSNVDKPEKTMAEKAAATGAQGTGTGSYASTSKESSSNVDKPEKTTAERVAVTGALGTGTVSGVEVSSPSSIDAQEGQASQSNVKETKKAIAPPAKPAPILKALENMVETAGLEAVEACSRYIRSYIMQQSCNDWVSSTQSQCACAKILTPAEVCEAATYVTTTWYKKSEEEKMAQLVLWIKQKKSGNLPFLLPSSQRGGSTGESTRLCRGAFMKLLFVPASMWRKAEARARALPSAASDATESAGISYPPESPIENTEKKSTENGMSVDQRSGCDKAGKVNAAAHAHFQRQQPQIETERTRESGADVVSTKPNQIVTNAIPQDILSDLKDSVKKPMAGHVAGRNPNAAKRLNQERTTASASKESSRNVDTPEKTMAKKAAATGARGTGTEASIVEVSSPSSFEGQAYAPNSNMKREKKTVAPTDAAVTMAQSETDANDKVEGDQEQPFKGVKNAGEEVSLSTDPNILAASAKRSFSGATASVGSGKGAPTGKSPPKYTAGVYGALNKMVETSGPHSVEACSRYIRSYIMHQSCYDWVSSTCTGCFCAKTLNPSQIWEAATYVTTTWYKKSEEEKMAQLVLWIKQKKSGNLPFLLPSVRCVGSTGEPKRLCRGAFMKLLFVPASMWRKAEERASPSATINSEENSSVRALDKPPGEHVRAAVNCFGKKFPCNVTGCPYFSQSKCPGMCLSHFNETIGKGGMSVDQRSGCNKAEKVNVARPSPVQIQQAQIGTKKTQEGGADNSSTTKPNGMITNVIPKNISKRKDCAEKPTSGQVAGNAVRRINQERAIKPAPLNSFVVALTKPMGMTLLQQSGRIQVAAIKTGSPAERSGKVSIGNVLLAVNGRDVTNMDVDNVVKMIRDGGSISDCLLFTSENSAQSGDACFDAKYSNSQGHIQRTLKVEDLSSFFSPLPIVTREKRGSHFHCSIEGCLKYSQRNCRGMCVSHFKESVAKISVSALDSPEKQDSTAAPASVSFVTPSPAKRGASNQNRCSVEGCSKYKQSKCNEMCRAHYLESRTKADNSIDNANFGRKRIEPRKPTRSHCGTCDACMVDECGECKHCLDMPRFGGGWKLRQKCLNRPACIVRGSSNSATAAIICHETDAKSAQKSGGKRKRSNSTPATEYTPPTIAVGEKIMKFFTDDFYEGRVERLPTKASSLFFVVYNDGDREELDEDGFWSAYSDYRVQKGLIQPSEFVPESLVVANDGRLAVVRSFRPASNGVDTTWSYRVHFTGWSTTFDKWMLEVDLRKQTKSTLKWAEKVRTSLGIKDRSKKKLKREEASFAPASKGALNDSVHLRKMMKTTQRESRGDHSYPLRSAPSLETKGASLKNPLPTNEQKDSIKSSKGVTVESISTKRPAKDAKAKSIPPKSIGCDVIMRQYPLRSSEPHLRRAAVDAKRKLSTPRKDVPKQAKKPVQRKNLSSKPRRTGDEKANVADADNYILPAIVVGTSILKYFVEGKDYFEGKITKLPTPAKKFYRIRYQDGDEEDMDPLELYMAFSDWCVANNEIPLTKFNPNQHVYAVDCGGVVREAVILSFCPVLKPGCMPGEWSWSYRVHFVGWHKRHDEWLDEDRLRKMSASSTKEKFQKEMDKQRALEAEISAKESADSPAKQARTGQKRGREVAAKQAKSTPPVKKYRWRCHRCDVLNAANHTKCSTCQAWKGGKMPRKEESEVVEISDESEVEDESNQEEEEGPAASSRCSVEGCNKYKQNGNDGMCRAHFLESQEANDDESSEDEESSGDESSEEGGEEEEEESELSDEESSDEEDMLNWRQRKRLTCAIEGCARLRQFGQRGTLCKLHFLEAQEEAENASSDKDSGDDSGGEADSDIVVEDNIGGGKEECPATEMESDANAASTAGTTRPPTVLTACSGSSGVLSGGQSSGGSNLMDMINILKDSDDEDDNDDEDLFAYMG